MSRYGRLTTFLQSDLDGNVVLRLNERFENKIYAGSKNAHVASLKANLAVIEAYHNGDKDFPSLKAGKRASPFLRHCFNHNLASTEHVTQSVQDAFIIFPTLVGRDGLAVDGCTEMFRTMANIYATNAVNHINMNWETFIEDAVDFQIVFLDIFLCKQE